MVSMIDPITPQVDSTVNQKFVQLKPGVDDNHGMETPAGKIIKDALGKLGKTQAWLAEQVGVSDNAVSKWIHKGQFSRENIPAIAKALNIDPNALVMASSPFGRMGAVAAAAHASAIKTMTGVAHLASNIAPYTVQRMGEKPIPLISWVQAGEWSEVIDNFAPGDAEEWPPCPVRHSASTFALRVRGESMQNPLGRPSFCDGDLIFVDPERPAMHNSLVIVRLDDSKEATFKRLVIEGDQQYLRPLNPAWPEQVIRINGNATMCGVVIFKGEIL